MMSIIEKAAYLKGLAEGLGVDSSTKEGKLFNAIIEILSDIASDVDGLDSYVDELSEQVNTIDEDLDALETDFYDDLCDDDDDCDCDELDADYYDIECESCNNEFTVDEDTLLQGEVVCPHCGEKLEFEVDCDCDECNCDADEKN